MPMVEHTVPYKTWVKRSVTEALGRVFTGHPDPLLKKTNVTIEYPNEEAAYPAIIVRFYERAITNAGVGHEEYIEIDGSDYRFKHYAYTGDLEFAIHTLSAYDRDLTADSLIQTLGMGNLTGYTNEFFKRIYDADETEYPMAEWNYINVNIDQISGSGETQQPAPWGPEDALVYSVSYRVGCNGEFYSLPPDSQLALGYIEQVDQYPYIEDLEPIPTGDANDPAEWKPPLPD